MHSFFRFSSSFHSCLVYSSSAIGEPQYCWQFISAMSKLFLIVGDVGNMGRGTSHLSVIGESMDATRFLKAPDFNCTVS